MAWFDMNPVLANQVASGACTPSPDPNSQGFCLMADGSEVMCDLIRECRPDQHFEYALPGGTQNVNTRIFDPAAEGGFVWTNPTIPQPTIIGQPLATNSVWGSPDINYYNTSIPWAVVPVQTQRGGPGTAPTSPTYGLSRMNETRGGDRGPRSANADGLTATSGYVSANMLSPTLMRDRLVSLTGNDMGTPDEWCFVYNQFTGIACPAPEDMGFIGASRTARIDADGWLAKLRDYEQAVYTGPGTIGQPSNVSGAFGNPVYQPGSVVPGVGGGSTGGAAAAAAGGNNLIVIGMIVLAAVVLMRR